MLRLLGCFLFFLQVAQAQVLAEGSDLPPNPSLIEEPIRTQQLDSIEEEESLRLLYHRPIYFIYGSPLTKVQFSFRAPLVENFPLNFAYSQMIFWKLQESSKPFLDATYSPEFFYRFTFKDSYLRYLDAGIWEHSSNGKAGNDSRSFDQSYLRFLFAFEVDQLISEVGLKVRHIYNIDDSNQNIRDYVGPVELEMRFTHLFNDVLDRGEFELILKPGGRYGREWSRGGYQFGFNFKIKDVRVVPRFYVQYYEGYAETLLNYNERERQVRAGLLF